MNGPGTCERCGREIRMQCRMGTRYCSTRCEAGTLPDPEPELSGTGTDEE